MLTPLVPALLFLVFSAALAAASAVHSGFPGLVLTLERVFPANESDNLGSLEARDRSRHARMLQGVEGVVNFSVSGNSDLSRAGLYFTRVELGSPPKAFHVVIDTGSDLLWVNCDSCTNCPYASNLGIELKAFNIGNSSTASLVSCSHPACSSIDQTGVNKCSQNNQCSYSLKYKDGSGTFGYYTSDRFYFDTVLENSVVADSSAPIIFGWCGDRCSVSQSGDLTTENRATDGIFGFGQHDISVVSQLSRLGVTPKVFSHCLKGSGGGILVLGEISDPGIVYTPLVKSQAHYYVNLQSISINGNVLQIDPTAFSTSSHRGTLIDSGTTLTYLIEEAYDPFISAVTPVISQYAAPVDSQGYQWCYPVPSANLSSFPLVSLNFVGDAPMVLKPEEYLIRAGFEDNLPLWCVGILKSNGREPTILGDLVLKDKIVVYDLERQRVGWADYNCSLSVRVLPSSLKPDAGQINASISSRKGNLLPILTVIGILLLNPRSEYQINIIDTLFI